MASLVNPFALHYSRHGFEDQSYLTLQGSNGRVHLFQIINSDDFRDYCISIQSQGKPHPSMTNATVNKCGCAAHEFLSDNAVPEWIAYNSFPKSLVLIGRCELAPENTPTPYSDFQRNVKHVASFIDFI